MIGAGIVAIPSACYAGGMSYGLLLCLILCPALAFGSGYLFTKCKQMAPVDVDTLYELCYVTLGRWSIYLVAFVAVVNNVGFCIIYFILFCDNASSLSQAAGITGLVGSRTFWAIALGAALLPVILKEELHEIRLLSYFLFSVASFYLLLLINCQIFTPDKYNSDPEPHNYFAAKWGLDMVSSFSVFLCAFNFSFAEFPVYHALGPHRSSE